jgi:hypothetical protein
MSDFEDDDVVIDDDFNSLDGSLNVEIAMTASEKSRLLTAKRRAIEERADLRRMMSDFDY